MIYDFKVQKSPKPEWCTRICSQEQKQLYEMLVMDEIDLMAVY